MNRFEKAFNGARCAFIIAIHVRPELEHLAADITIARGEGADGVIVIKDYETPATNEDVLEAYQWVRERYPKWWIGVNFLGYALDEAVLHAPSDVSGIWGDQSGIEEKLNGADSLVDVRTKLDCLFLPNPPLFMPSVAMKYQRQPTDLAFVTRLAGEYADVVVTSGTATGVPAELEKVSVMCASTDTPVGLASGVAADNVRRYIDRGVKVFIVNTAISTNGRLDAAKTGALRDKIPR